MNRDDNNNSSPQFTRRHYIWLANAMKKVFDEVLSEYPEADDYKIKFGIETFAEALAADNPNFNKQRFLNNIFNPTTPT